MQQSHRKLLLLTAIGGALEFCDFTIYALFAPYISQLFFPIFITVYQNHTDEIK